MVLGKERFRKKGTLLESICLGFYLYSMLMGWIDVVVVSLYWHINIRTTSESPRLLGESVSKYLHANKASGEVDRSLGKF